MANLIRRDHREVAQNRGRDYGLDPLRSWDPFRMMDALLRWDPFREGGGWMSHGGGETYVPQFDVKETKDGYLFRADLPGVKESDLQISVTGNILTISGRREQEHREEGDQYFTLERSAGEFTRSFSLPDGVDADSATAELNEGVLTIHLSKKPEVQPKKIALGKSGGEKGGKA